MKKKKIKHFEKEAVVLPNLFQSILINDDIQLIGK